MTEEAPRHETSAQHTEDEAAAPDPSPLPDQPGKKKKLLLATLPRILTGIAAVLTAIGGILTLFVSDGGLSIGKRAPTELATESADTGLRVVATIPENEAQDVDPALTEITIVFSQAINQEQWSFTETDSGITPEISGDPYFPDATTCVLPVKLEPDTTYGLGINSAAHQNFVSSADPSLAAEPYTLSFSTGP